MTTRAAIEAAVKALEEALKCQTKKNDYPTVIWIQEALTLLRAIPEQAGDLPTLKAQYLAYQEECEGEPQDYKKPFIQGAWNAIDWIAASGRLAQGWREISTAPKDGTKIYLWPTDGTHHKHCEPQTTIGFWYEPNEGTKYQKGKWTAWNKCSDPQKWMPLPPAPGKDGAG